MRTLSACVGVLLGVLLLSVLSLSAQPGTLGAQPKLFHGCPAEGDNTVNVRTRSLDVLKNRTAGPLPSDFDTAATLSAVLSPFHDDRARWSAARAAVFEGYVVLVKSGGRETANCHALSAALTDTHFELALTPSTLRPHTVVTEITPRWREAQKAQGIDWSTSALRKLLGKKVHVEGWLLLDVEHLSQSENTHSPGSKTNWRQTAWELHPVTKIEVLQAPKQ